MTTDQRGQRGVARCPGACDLPLILHTTRSAVLRDDSPIADPTLTTDARVTWEIACTSGHVLMHSGDTDGQPFTREALAAFIGPLVDDADATVGRHRGDDTP